MLWYVIVCYGMNVMVCYGMKCNGMLWYECNVCYGMNVMYVMVWM